MGIESANRHPDVLRNAIFEQRVEDALEGPIFVIDYPASICPLTKRKADRPEIAERFELFIQGMEIANAYTELNDPDLQEQLFRTQLAGLPEEDSMARMDGDFIRALRHGMPPAGGLGIGIDRLVMLLTNTQYDSRCDPVSRCCGRRDRRCSSAKNGIVRRACNGRRILPKDWPCTKHPSLPAISAHPLHRAGLDHQRDAGRGHDDRGQQRDVGVSRTRCRSACTASFRIS